MRPPCSTILPAIHAVRVMVPSRKTSWFLDLAATPSYDPDTRTRKAFGHAMLNGPPCTYGNILARPAGGLLGIPNYTTMPP